MYSAPSGDQSMHHQTGKNIGSAKIQNYYWRSVICCFASATTHIPESRRILLVNALPPKHIDGIKIDALLKDYNVEIHLLDQITRPSSDYHNAWNTQFIVIDALEILSTLASDRQPVLLLDSDCVFVRPIASKFYERLDEYGILRYNLPIADDVEENGLSNFDLAALASQYDPSITRKVIRYAGGEIFFGRADLLPEIIRLARSAFKQSQVRHGNGLKKFNEEAHLLTYVYEVLNSPELSANDFIKRIWTDRGVYSSVAGDEEALTIWHLPAEKKAGIVKMFRHLGRRGRFPSSTTECARWFRLDPSFRDKIMMQVKRFARGIRNQFRN